MATTHDLIAAFGSVEDDNGYTRLVDAFADDAIYYDPFFGPQIGKAAIHDFMAHMEELVPKSGARFADWQVTAGTNCGFAQWNMVAPSADGQQVYVPGESLYRIRGGEVLGVVDYVDPVAYTRLRGDNGRIPDFLGGAGSLPEPDSPNEPPAADLRSHVESMSYAGRWTGTADLVDHAGDNGVGWAQWTFHGPHGDFAGWSLCANGQIRDFFDTVSAHNHATNAT